MLFLVRRRSNLYKQTSPHKQTLFQDPNGVHYREVSLCHIFSRIALWIASDDYTHAKECGDVVYDQLSRLTSIVHPVTNKAIAVTC